MQFAMAGMRVVGRFIPPTNRVMMDLGRRIPNGLGRRIPNSLDLGRRIPNFIQIRESSDKCKKLEDLSTRQKIICKRPDLKRKPLPPYKYGYCREPDVQMPMSCPPKVKKRGKGPCCHDDVQMKAGGCKVKK